jgi:hypothetical protein
MRKARTRSRATVLKTGCRWRDVPLPHLIAKAEALLARGAWSALSSGAAEPAFKAYTISVEDAAGPFESREETHKEGIRRRITTDLKYAAPHKYNGQKP